MLLNLFILANLILVAAFFFAVRLPEVHRKFSFAILQALFFLPLLVMEYLGVVLNLVPDPGGFTILLASQNLFLIIWGTVARRLRDAMAESRPEPTAIIAFFHAAIVSLILTVTVFQVLLPSFEISREGIRFSKYGPVYFASIISLLVMLFMAWQLEAFWRQLPKSRRREYGLFLVGSALVCAVQGGVASYRLTYLELANEIPYIP